MNRKSSCNIQLFLLPFSMCLPNCAVLSYLLIEIYSVMNLKSQNNGGVSKYCHKWAIIIIRMIFIWMFFHINVEICFCLKWKSHNHPYCYYHKILRQALVHNNDAMYWFFVLHYWVSRIEIISFSSNSVFPSIHARFIYRSECNTIFFVK